MRPVGRDERALSACGIVPPGTARAGAGKPGGHTQGQTVSWTDDLVTAIKEAVAAGEACTIVVPSQAQQNLGQSALSRMAPGATHVSFRVDPSAGTSARLIREGENAVTPEVGEAP